MIEPVELDIIRQNQISFIVIHERTCEFARCARIVRKLFRTQVFQIAVRQYVQIDRVAFVFKCCLEHVCENEKRFEVARFSRQILYI